MKNRFDAADFAIVVALAVLAGAFSVYLLTLWQGQLPLQNQYFGADTERVFANLIDRRSSFFRATVHPVAPFFYAISIRLSSLLGLTPQQVLTLLAGMNGAAFAASIYATCRLLQVAKSLAAAGAILSCSSASFIYWVSVPETHFASGIFICIAITLLCIRQVSTIDRLLISTFAFVVTFGMLVTNAVLWGLAQVEVEGLRAKSIGKFLSDNVSKLSESILVCAAGIGLIAIFQILTVHLLGNFTVGRLLFFAEEPYYFGKGGFWSTAFDPLGVIAPGSPSVVFGFLIALALVFALWRAPPERKFIPAFVLFGLAFHRIYDPGEAFLFAPNYLPAVIVALLVTPSKVRPRLAVLVILVASIPLIAWNLHSYKLTIASLRSQSVSVDVLRKRQNVLMDEGVLLGVHPSFSPQIMNSP